MSPDAFALRLVDGGNHCVVVWALFAADAVSVTNVTGFAVAGQFVPALGTFRLSTVARDPRGAVTNIWMNLWQCDSVGTIQEKGVLFLADWQFATKARHHTRWRHGY